MSWTFNTDSSPRPLSSPIWPQATSTTENLYMEGFNASGAATNSGPVLIASNLPDGTPYFIGYDSYDGYATAIGIWKSAARWARVWWPADVQHDHDGAVGTPTPVPSLPDYTSFNGIARHTFRPTAISLRLVEGVENGQAVIQSFLNGNSTAHVDAQTFDLTAANDHFATTNVYDTNNGQLDYIALAYTDAGKVHLELLNENGSRSAATMSCPAFPRS